MLFQEFSVPVATTKIICNNIIQGYLYFKDWETHHILMLTFFDFFCQNCLPSVSVSLFLIVFNHILYLMNYIPVRVPLDVEYKCINNKQDEHNFFQATKV